MLKDGEEAANLSIKIWEIEHRMYFNDMHSQDGGGRSVG